MLAATNFEHAMNYSYLAASPLGSTADQAPRAGPSESLLFLQALRAAGALRNFFVENASFSPRDLCSKAKEESMKAFEVEDGNKRRLEERIRPFQLFVNEDTDNTGDCQFDSAADQLRLLPGNAHLTKELVRQTVIDWLRRNPNYRLSADDPTNTDTLASWIHDTQGLEWTAYVDAMAKPRAWGDEVTMKALVECFHVKVLLWSSTVSVDNYFSVHRPAGGEEAAVGTLCLCHFLEVHYGSLLSKEEYARRQAEKREAFIRVVQQLGPTDRLDALCDVFLQDNARNARTLDRAQISAALQASGGHLQLTFERLLSTLALSCDTDLVLPLHRVNQYRAKLPPTAVPVRQPALAAAAPAADDAHVNALEDELSKALELIRVLKEEISVVRLENATLRDKAAAAGGDLITCDTLVDEDGKKWVRARWAIGAPVAGDMLALWRVARHEVTAKQIQRVPASGDTRGVALFEQPATIAHYVVVYSRKGAELLRSEPFILGPQVVLSLQSVDGPSRVIHWTMTDSSIARSSDWIAAFRVGETSMRNYETSAYVNPTSNVVTLKVASNPVVVRYFASDNKYYPIAEMNVEAPLK